MGQPPDKQLYFTRHLQSEDAHVGRIPFFMLLQAPTGQLLDMQLALRVSKPKVPRSEARETDNAISMLQAATGQPPDMQLALRVSKSALRTSAFQEEVVTQVRN